MAKKDQLKEQPTGKLEIIGSVDLTPSWVGLYSTFCNWIDSGNKQQKETVKAELLKLCKMADDLNEVNKKKAEV